jgi:hypothetical protein
MKYKIKQFIEFIFLEIMSIILSFKVKKVQLQANHKLDYPLIVSLTSYPPRFPTLDLTLKSLLCQRMSPDKIILWIEQEHIPMLPRRVLGLCAYGVEILPCEPLRSYKKIIPSLEAYPDACIVTADDDAFYSSHWLESLVLNWSRSNKEIVCHRAHRITYDEQGRIKTYSEWKHEEKGPILSDKLFPTGVGGVLYPPHSLHEDVLQKIIFMDLCSKADDVWLFWMGKKNGCTYRLTDFGGRFLTWRSSQKSALYLDNVEKGENDIQIKNLIQKFGAP